MKRYILKDKHTWGILATLQANSEGEAKSRFLQGNPAYRLSDIIAIS